MHPPTKHILTLLAVPILSLAAPIHHRHRSSLPARDSHSKKDTPTNIPTASSKDGFISVAINTTDVENIGWLADNGTLISEEASKGTFKIDQINGALVLSSEAGSCAIDAMNAMSCGSNSQTNSKTSIFIEEGVNSADPSQISISMVDWKAGDSDPGKSWWGSEGAGAQLFSESNSVTGATVEMYLEWSEPNVFRRRDDGRMGPALETPVDVPNPNQDLNKL